jgi:hypothetical protein
MPCTGLCHLAYPSAPKPFSLLTYDSSIELHSRAAKSAMHTPWPHHRGCIRKSILQCPINHAVFTVFFPSPWGGREGSMPMLACFCCCCCCCCFSLPLLLRCVAGDSPNGGTHTPAPVDAWHRAWWAGMRGIMVVGPLAEGPATDCPVHARRRAASPTLSLGPWAGGGRE